jgi:aminomethyltransferase
MPEPTPFHSRTSALCTSLLWKDWAGCHAVRSFDTSHEREYHAFRQSAGLIDVSPLYKYDLRGPGAGELLARVMVRDVRRLQVGRMTYLCWCDDDGKVLDDGTVGRLDEDWYRVTAAEPALAWLSRHARGLDVAIEDVSRRLAALALQGPAAREILAGACDADLAALRYFRVTRARLGTAEVHVSRTGYTGDLGYEIWVASADALAVWDALVHAGRPYRMEPAGLDALDVTRVEAGFIMNGVDYFSANHCPIESRKSTPLEIGLGRIVELEGAPFIGRDALRAEVARGARWTRVGLEIDWDEFEALYAALGLPPQVPRGAWRTPVPVYDRFGRQVGQATSGAWSPILKRNLALATVLARVARAAPRLRIEVTAEYRRHRLGATIAPLPFFDPARKRA